MRDRVEDVELSLLQAWSVRGITLDLDNTIVPWHTSDMPASVEAWAATVRAAGIRMCLLTNNYSRQAVHVAERLSIPIVRGALKPLPGGFWRSLAHLQLPASAVVGIGDQIFTDVLGAKLVGMRAILVRPVSRREFPTTKVMRIFERPLLARLRREHAGGA
jgi:HAD superfamily phosphatase (TIGR01668 family)